MYSHGVLSGGSGSKRRFAPSLHTNKYAFDAELLIEQEVLAAEPLHA